jgi:hypothetical protein
VFHNVLEAAVEAGHLQTNPLNAVRSHRRTVEMTLDRRVVVNPEQAAALLAAVGTQAPALEAFSRASTTRDFDRARRSA